MAAAAPVVGRAVASRPRREPRDLEARLVAEARSPAALRRVLARVAGRMVATRGWDRLGFARLGDYEVERAGVSARELHDLAHVDAALARLPALDAAVARGEIGWTQLRLLCRVATEDDEARWLELASRLTARALAREVRAVDRVAREPLSAVDEDGDRRDGIVLRLTPRARARWWSARQVASRVAGHALSHGAFAEVLVAEVMSGVDIDGNITPDETESVRARDRGGSRGDSPEIGERRRAPAGLAALPSPEVAALERDLADADAFELDRRLRLAVRMEARGLARVGRLLADVVAWGLHRDAGYNGLDRYAEERLGISASRARALLRIERAARACPPLREAFAAGRLSWVQAHRLVPLLLEPAAERHREGWVAHAGRVSVRRLGDDVERALASGDFEPPPLAPQPAPDPGADPVGLQTGAITGSVKETARLLFTVPLEVGPLFRAILATVQRRLERIRGRPACRSDALEAMLDHALAAWRPERPTARERREWAVFERDGWRCTAPGCTSYRNLERHHVVFRSRGGSDEPSNLTTLCAWHHRRGIHTGVLRCTGAAPEGLRFELGLRAGAPPLAVYGSGDIRMSP